MLEEKFEEVLPINKPEQKNEEEILDKILDKITEFGYNSLIQSEKEFLDYYSKK
jgi:phosphoenolpyruvate carboxylase